ncbi:glutamate receptor ionotropic, delta-1 [Trichonephila inaurata madagascariensis]|uniref:Glutamate receptor ionotropic, delta-1 n=1 Tax=Trichonephila inaurata madagascariensis TaxID=2747483 RepID=A0A8X6XAX9_9ARAC|nr:glutamate receptor ionotropic, delta-1 [Trichonephila inaurata madagascariensis]
MNFSKWIIAALNLSKVFEVYIDENGKTRIAGIEGCFAHAIFTEMNIEYDIVLSEDNEFGREINNGSWTGIVGMVQRGETDLAIGSLGINEDRFRVADYSFPYASDGMNFVVLKPSEWSKAFGFLELFDLPTWMLLLCIFLLATVMFFTMLKDTTSYFEVFHNLFGSMLRQPLILHIYLHKNRLLTGTWLLFSCIMSSVFSGALLSFLVTPSNVETIKNFKELSEAVERGTHRAYSGKGTIVVPFLLNSKELYLRQLGRTIEQNNWYLRSEDVMNNPMKYLESVLVGSSEYLRFLYGAHSRVLISEENGYSISMAFAIRKGFCCSSQLRKVMSRMNQVVGLQIRSLDGIQELNEILYCFIIIKDAVYELVGIFLPWKLPLIGDIELLNHIIPVCQNCSVRKPVLILEVLLNVRKHLGQKFARRVDNLTTWHNDEAC